MTEDMPRPRPRYLHRYVTRHGKMIWYVRLPGKRRVRIRGEFGSPEFEAHVDAALAGLDLKTPKRPIARAGTVEWLWDKYRDTPAWASLSKATRRQRENIMVKVLATIRHTPYTAIKRGDIAASRDKRKDTPAQARNFLDVMRGLFRWALEAEYIKVDPTAGVSNPLKPASEGFLIWTDGDVERYQTKWPLGTKERVWLDVLLYTGLRRGDAVAIGRQHVRDGIAVVRTEKSRREVLVTIPILPILQATLDKGPVGELSFICGVTGRPLTKESFGNMFKAACRGAGLTNRSAHGVRKIAATTAANNGATVAQLEAIFGWQGGQMAALYTKAANRRRLAIDAMHMLGRTPEEQSSCQPSIVVSMAAKKA